MNTATRRNGAGQRLTQVLSAPVVAWINAVLLAALVILNFEPLRSAFGRATGLWHPCIPTAAGLGYERWSPFLILIVMVPVIVGLRLAWQTAPHRQRTRLVMPSVLLLALAIGFVVVPTGSCIA